MRPLIRDAARAFGVVFGPSVLLDTAAGAALASAVHALRRHRRPSRARCARERPDRRLPRRRPPADAALGRHLRGAARADPAVHSTRAVTVEAPPEAVWPWLAQLGQDRAGFYSYDWLENLAGCEMHNADAVHAEWQRREPGETVYLHPLRGLPVARFEPGHVLVLEGWGAFVLEPHGPGCTRLIARGRAPRGIGAVTNALLMEIPHFLMERKMLLGIKERAERAHTVAVRRAAQSAPVAEAVHA